MRSSFHIRKYILWRRVVLRVFLQYSVVCQQRPYSLIVAKAGMISVQVHVIKLCLSYKSDSVVLNVYFCTVSLVLNMISTLTLKV